MSLYSLYLSNPQMDSILVLHMERKYIGAAQWKTGGGGLIFSIFLENW